MGRRVFRYRGLIGIRLLGWQLDYRTWLPLSVRTGPGGWPGHRMVRLGRGWLVVGKVRGR